MTLSSLQCRESLSPLAVSRRPQHSTHLYAWVANLEIYPKAIPACYNPGNTLLAVYTHPHIHASTYDHCHDHKHIHNIATHEQHKHSSHTTPHTTHLICIVLRSSTTLALRNRLRQPSLAHSEIWRSILFVNIPLGGSLSFYLHATRLHNLYLIIHIHS